MVRLLSIAAALSIASVAVLAEVASADEIVLVSGARYEASDIVVGDASVRFTYSADGRAATITVPMAWIQPESLYGLVHARTGASDAKGQLRLGNIALAGGLESAAEARFLKASALDTALAAESAAGLQRLSATREQEAQRLLASAEDDFRHERYAAAIDGARAAETRAGESSLTAIRAAGLKELATRLLERDRLRTEADAKARADALAAAGAQQRAKADALAAAEAAWRADEAAQRAERAALLEAVRLRQSLDLLTNEIALARRRAACAPPIGVPCGHVSCAPPVATATCLPLLPVRERWGAGAAQEPTPRVSWFDSRVPHPPPAQIPAPAPTPTVRPAPVEVPANLPILYYGFPNGTPHK